MSSLVRVIVDAIALQAVVGSILAAVGVVLLFKKTPAATGDSSVDLAGIAKIKSKSPAITVLALGVVLLLHATAGQSGPKAEAAEGPPPQPKGPDELTTYTTQITDQDHCSSANSLLQDASDILEENRYHAHLNPPPTDPAELAKFETYFGNEPARKALKALATNALKDKNGLQNKIVEGTPTLAVTVHRQANQLTALEVEVKDPGQPANPPCLKRDR